MFNNPFPREGLTDATVRQWMRGKVSGPIS